MSASAKATLAASVVTTCSIIYYVHVKQEEDRKNLRKGVVRDLHQQELKKKVNLLMLDEQQALTKILMKQREEDMEGSTNKYLQE